MRHASADGGPGRRTRGLLYCGLAAGPVFVTAFLAEGATRKEYRPLRHPVSSLALGPRGWIQTANFAVTGTLVLVGAAGVGRTRDPALSTRFAPSRTGTIHNLTAVPVFVGLSAAAFTYGRRSAGVGQRGFGLYGAATAMTMLATVALAGAGFNQSPRLVNHAGLFQRASIVTGFGWLTALSARALMRAQKNAT